MEQAEDRGDEGACGGASSPASSPPGAHVSCGEGGDTAADAPVDESGGGEDGDAAADAPVDESGGGEDGDAAADTPVDESGGAGTGATVITDQEEFLAQIHEKFLDLVHPIESRLTDHLRQADALSSEDEQSIAAENTRRKKARKLWSKLQSISEEDFACSFVPQLSKAYPQVTAGLTFRLMESADKDKCLRHVMIKRLNLKRLVDLLQSVRCCSIEEYRRLTALQHCGVGEWEEVFQLLQHHSSSAPLCEAMESMLKKKKIRSPGQYRLAAATGFVCTCHVSSSQLCTTPPPIAATEDARRAVQELCLRDEEESSATYPSSPLSCHSRRLDLEDFECTDSGMGSDFEAIQFTLFSDLQQFVSVSHKNRYKEVEDQINSALTRASNIRTDFRFLEKIRDDARSLAKQAEDETPSAGTNRRLQSLLDRAREYLSGIRSFLAQVQATWAAVRSLEDCFGFDLPEDWKRYLMVRHHLLRNEVQECQHFVERAAGVYEEVTIFCQPVPLAE